MAKPSAKLRVVKPGGAAPISDQVRLTALCETDLKTFVEEAWPIVVPSEPFQDNWHVDAICEHLEWLTAKQFWSLLINIPPRFGKSLLVSVMFPAWLWIRDATIRHVSSSYAQQLSTRDSLATRRLIESGWYQERWGDRFYLTSDQNEKTKFENNRKGFRLATSVGGVATGEGGDLITVDDPHNVNEIESETVRQGVLTWWNVTMPTRSGRGGRSMRVVVMQRVHEMDLSADIIAKKSYVHLCLPMEYEAAKDGKRRRTWNGWTDPRQKAGALLWPGRFSEEIISATLRPPHMSSVAYAGQYQQRPAPSEGGLFKVAWWKYYKPLAGVVEDMIRKADDKCFSWDMTFKDKKTSDFVAGTGWIRIGADFFLLPHCVHERLSFTATKSQVKLCAAKYPTLHAKLVEDKANGTAVIDDLANAVGGLIAIEPEGGKYARASVMQPYCESGNVYLPEGIGWVADYVEEFRVFDNGAHDDWVDSSSQAIVWLLKRMTHGFKPLSGRVALGNQSRRPGPGQQYHDPRGAEPEAVAAAGYSERGDMRRGDR